MVFFFPPCTLSACVHHCTHACGWHRARIFVCSHSVSIINGRKLIQFIAFTYWPESLLQGGIMAAWVCTKTGEEKGRVEEGEGEGKKMETCPYRKHIGATRWRLFTYWDKIKPVVGWIFYQTVKKQLIHIAQKKKKKWGNGDLQVWIHLTVSRGWGMIWCVPKMDFPFWPGW